MPDVPRLVIIRPGFLPDKWETKMLCEGKSDLFLRVDRRDSERARQHCSVCPSLLKCAEWAKRVPHKEGTWAGKTYGQRGRPRKHNE